MPPACLCIETYWILVPVTCICTLVPREAGLRNIAAIKEMVRFCDSYPGRHPSALRARRDSTPGQLGHVDGISLYHQLTMSGTRVKL